METIGHVQSEAQLVKIENEQLLQDLEAAEQMLDDQYDQIEEQKRVIDALNDQERSRQALIAQMNELY